MLLLVVTDEGTVNCTGAREIRRDETARDTNMRPFHRRARERAHTRARPRSCVFTMSGYIRSSSIHTFACWQTTCTRKTCRGLGYSRPAGALHPRALRALRRGCLILTGSRPRPNGRNETANALAVKRERLYGKASRCFVMGDRDY